MAIPFTPTNIYRYPAYITLLLFLCYCLSILPSLHPTFVPGAGFSGISILTGSILYICMGIRFFYYKKITLTKTDLYLFAAGVWMLLTTAGRDPDSIDAVTWNLYLFPFYLYFPLRVLLSGKESNSFLYLLIICILSQALYCVYNQLPDYQTFLELKGTFFNPGLFGGYMAIGVVVITSILLIKEPLPEKKSRHRCILYLLLLPVLLIFLYLLYISFSRAAWVAAGVTLTVLLYKRYKHTLKKKIKVPVRSNYLFISLVVLGLVGSIVFIYHLRPDSANGRLLIWQASSLLIRDSPLTGYGINGFSRNYMFSQGTWLEHHPDSPFALLAADTTLPFNEYIKLIVEQGVVGLSIWILLFLSVFQAHNPEKKEHLSMQKLKYILLCLAVFGFFSYPSGSFPYCLISIVCLAFISGSSVPVTTVRMPGNKIIGSLLVIGILIFSWMGKKTYCFLQSSHLFTQVYREAVSTGNPSLLSPLYSSLSSTPEYLLTYGRLLQEAGEADKALPVWEQLEKCLPTASQQVQKGLSYIALGDSAAAIQCWQTASRMVPSLLQPHYLLAKSYYEQDQQEKGLFHARKLIGQKPKSYLPDIYYMRQHIREIYPEVSGD